MKVEIEVETITIPEYSDSIFMATVTADVKFVDNGIGSYECHGTRGNDIQMEAELQDWKITSILLWNSEGADPIIWNGKTPSQGDIDAVKEKHGMDLLHIINSPSLIATIEEAVEDNVEDLDISQFRDVCDDD